MFTQGTYCTDVLCAEIDNLPQAYLSLTAKDIQLSVAFDC